MRYIPSLILLSFSLNSFSSNSEMRESISSIYANTPKTFSHQFAAFKNDIKFKECNISIETEERLQLRTKIKEWLTSTSFNVKQIKSAVVKKGNFAPYELTLSFTSDLANTKYTNYETKKVSKFMSDKSPLFFQNETTAQLTASSFNTIIEICSKS